MSALRRLYSTRSGYNGGNADFEGLSVVDGKIFNSRGVHVAIVSGPAIFDLRGKKLYDLKGVNIYKLSGELVGHLPDAQDTKRHLGKSTDKLFP
jgi:hypothetical protein